jgi:hypothetical protein
LVEQLSEGELGARFAVRKDDAWGESGQGLDPIDEVGLAGVSAEAAEGADLGFDGDFVAEDGDEFMAVDEATAERVLTLITDEQDAGFGAPEVLFKVMEDATGVAHAGAGHDEAGTWEIVEGTGLVGGGGEVESRNISEGMMIEVKREGLGVIEVGMGLVEAGGLDGHGAVEIDRKGADGAGVKEAREGVEDELGAADGEGWDEEFAVTLSGGGDDFIELGESLDEGPVVVIAVGGLEKDEVALGWPDVIVKDGCAYGAEVAGEDDGAGLVTILDVELDAGGAEEMAGFEESGLDAGGDLKGFIVGYGLGEAQDVFDVVQVEERFDGGFSGPLAFAVEAFVVSGLYFGGVEQDQSREVDGGGCGENRALVAVLGEQGEAACVIEVSVGEDNGVEAGDVEGGWEVVTFFGHGDALEHAEVDEDIGSRGLQKVGGAGDFAAGAVECDLHVGCVGACGGYSGSDCLAL